MQIVFLVMMFIIGACLGSFLCCQARRLRFKIKHHTSLGSRSVCLSCKKQLKWYDNIPILSWLILRGKCRYCGKAIGSAEIISELAVAASFVILGVTIDIASAGIIDWLIFGSTLALTISLCFLAIYDGLYGELPTPFLILSIILAAVVLGIKEWVWILDAEFSASYILDPLLSVIILGGLYLVLYLISRGKWVGDGDWLLGLSLGLALANPWLAVVALFIANFLASVVMLPFIKKRPSHKIYFGPFLVAAFVITYGFSDLLLTVMP